MIKPKSSDTAYGIIKKRIVDGEIEPGTIISENALSKELGMSRTPVREAITALESEGFVRTIPQRGCEVVKLDIKDIISYMQVREGLEGVAARVAVPQADPRRFRELLAELESVDLRREEERTRGFEVGRRLHSLILETAGNAEIIRIVGNMMGQLDRIMILSRNAESRYRISHEEHLVICKAILEKDPDRAEQALRSHIIGSFNDAIKVLQQSYY